MSREHVTNNYYLSISRFLIRIIISHNLFLIKYKREMSNAKYGNKLFTKYRVNPFHFVYIRKRIIYRLKWGENMK